MVRPRILRITLTSIAVSLSAAANSPAFATASPGQSLLENCQLIDRSNLAPMELVGRAVCLSTMHTTLSVHRQLTLAALDANERKTKAGGVEGLRQEPSPFCRIWSRDRAVTMLEAADDIRGLVKFLNQRAQRELVPSGPGDDVHARLISAYLVAEYPCDEYFRTFGWEAKKYRPMKP